LIGESKVAVAPDLFVTNASDDNVRRNVFAGFELGMNARLPHRILAFGGWTMESANAIIRLGAQLRC